VSRSRYRSPVIQVLVIAVLLVAVGFVIAGVVPGSSHRLRHAAAGWIAVEVVLELLAIGAYALLFHGVFSDGEYRIGYLRATQIGVGELGAFVVAPGGAGGPALRIWALLRIGMPFAVQMVRTVIHAAVFNIPYVVAAILLGLSVVLGVGSGHARVLVALAPLALVIVSVALVGAAWRLARHQHGEPQTRWQRIGRDIIQAVPEGVRELPSWLRRPGLVLAAVGYWAGDCGVLVVAFAAAHGSAPVAVIVLAYMLGQLGNALPLPGGVGAVEPAMLGVLTSSGVNLALGAAAVVLYRFVSLGLQAATGAVAVSTLIPALQRQPASSAEEQPGG
jgi:putative heme transporter